jgi:hypothetical protein
MDWRMAEFETQASAKGRVDTYLVFGDEREVRLTRHRSVLYVNRAYEAARNVIVFPMGRGPGRPAGVPEIAALMESAKHYAERFEAGESLEGYPAWRQAGDQVLLIEQQGQSEYAHYGNLDNGD